MTTGEKKDPSIGLAEIPGDFSATLGGDDGAVPVPWRASYAISLSVVDGVRLMYVIDHAALTPWAWRVPVDAVRRQAVARMALSAGVLSRGDDRPASSDGGYRWLRMTAFGRSGQRVLPVVGSDEDAALANAFHALIPASVWQLLAERRAEFLAGAASDGGTQRGER
ncbi:hypothetical protein SAMN04489712_13822 [Thermomonospora echinospora]|uniref:Uncharacterized protein n=1 Tax=Thermomonospora echinospora TaxID=1992 RepID=A0A1H6E7V0_9ACTN|nr:hypothetical protein [Thermomonospora echinospora]SEG93331.1 hypothetical protein SAMN04489712_13822 [Thermomonospora echinospora]